MNEIFSQVLCAVFQKGSLGPDRCSRGELSRAGGPRACLGQGELGRLHASEKVSQSGNQCFL